MKFILKNIEKIIFVIFLVLFIVVIIVAKIGLIKEVQPITFPQIPEEFKTPERDRLQFRSYDELIRKIRKPKSLSAYPYLSKRSLCYEYEEPKPPEPPFMVKDIQVIPLNIIYQGVIELGGGELLAQVNFEGKTHFLKAGNVFADYEVKTITKDFCIVLDAKGKEKRLPYKRKVFSEEHEALLYDPKTKELLKVKKGFKIREYEILDIKATYVVLLDKSGKQIILKKGEK